VIFATPIEQPAQSPLGFSFSVLFDHVDFQDGTGFAFLDVLDEQGQELFRIRAMRVINGLESSFVLSLQYQISESLFGSMALGEFSDGEDCFWVERTEWIPWALPNYTGIRVVRSSSGQQYDSGSVALSRTPSVIRQGVMDLVGEPSGTLWISEAEIGEGCPP